ncbi:MAG: alpha/beta fold hydrolase [Advenella sp.]|uniref:Proline iminopeptidase n=1 Tax=Advenella kashmirensis TaxID=310575 RepID=A0A356LEL1_9BURK|nr:alpha/beta fold hydrolase [Advenella sp. FME57]HBP29416.1 hypothetical protein [Advenella kashmirensis]
MSMPLSQGYLQTPDGHQLYYAEFGNVRAPAAVVLHGGPGSSSNLAMLDWFDLRRWRVVLFDQRGSGKSLPTGSLEHNTTAHLVDDIERLRQHLAISAWTVVGGSWGAYLALAYVARYAASIHHLVLRGTFLPSRLQLDWFFQQLQALVPQAWDSLTETMSDSEKESVLLTLADRLLGSDREKMSDAAERWSNYENNIMGSMMQGKPAQQASSGQPAQKKHTQAQGSAAQAAASAQPQGEDGERDQGQARAAARNIHKYRIQAHYLRHTGFIDLPALLAQLRQVPVKTTLLHGTHDWICPAANVHMLQRFLPGADLCWVPGGTHTPSDPLILAALTDTMTRLSAAS